LDNSFFGMSKIFLFYWVICGKITEKRLIYRNLYDIIRMIYIKFLLYIVFENGS